MDLKELKNIGLTKGEIKVYGAILNLGDCTKTSLAKESGISPSNIYDVTNRLLKKGLISKLDKNGVAHFSPANPNRIMDFISKKEEEINKEKEILNKLLPSLNYAFNTHKNTRQVEVFEGWNGLKTVFEDLLEECNRGDYNYISGASVGGNKDQADIIFLKYSKLREEKGIRSKIIFNKRIFERMERIKFFRESEEYEVRFLDQDTPAEIMLYKDKTCIIILTEQPLTVRISSKQVFDSFKQNFDILWKKAKPE